MLNLFTYRTSGGVTVSDNSAGHKLIGDSWLVHYPDEADEYEHFIPLNFSLILYTSNHSITSLAEKKKEVVRWVI